LAFDWWYNYKLLRTSLIGIMEVRNYKTLHLVIDTGNGTVFDNKIDPLNSGTTFNETILGTSKDSDGNTLWSDVIKYIVP